MNRASESGVASPSDPWDAVRVLLEERTLDGQSEHRLRDETRSLIETVRARDAVIETELAVKAVLDQEPVDGTEDEYAARLALELSRDLSDPSLVKTQRTSGIVMLAYGVASCNATSISRVMAPERARNLELALNQIQWRNTADAAIAGESLRMVGTVLRSLLRLGDLAHGDQQDQVDADDRSELPVLGCLVERLVTELSFLVVENDDLRQWIDHLELMARRDTSERAALRSELDQERTDRSVTQAEIRHLRSRIDELTAHRDALLEQLERRDFDRDSTGAEALVVRSQLGKLERAALAITIVTGLAGSGLAAIDTFSPKDVTEIHQTIETTCREIEAEVGMELPRLK